MTDTQNNKNTWKQNPEKKEFSYKEMKTNY